MSTRLWALGPGGLLPTTYDLLPLLLLLPPLLLLPLLLPTTYYLLSCYLLLITLITLLKAETDTC